MPQPQMLNKLKFNGSMKTYKTFWNYHQRNKIKYVLFIIGNWNAKVGSQEIPGVIVMFDFEYKMKQVKG